MTLNAGGPGTVADLPGVELSEFGKACIISWIEASDSASESRRRFATMDDRRLTVGQQELFVYRHHQSPSTYESVAWIHRGIRPDTSVDELSDSSFGLFGLSDSDLEKAVGFGLSINANNDRDPRLEAAYAVQRTAIEDTEEDKPPSFFDDPEKIIQAVRAASDGGGEPPRKRLRGDDIVCGQPFVDSRGNQNP